MAGAQLHGDIRDYRNDGKTLGFMIAGPSKYALDRNEEARMPGWI